MATISLSSSLIAYSNIKQNPAKFSFPVTFPFIFNIQNQTNSIRGSSNIVANTTLIGQITIVTPIISHVTSISSINGSITNALKLITPVNVTSTMGTTTIKSQLGLISVVILTTNIVTILSNKINVIGAILPTINIMGIVSSTFKGVTNIVANSSIAITTSIQEKLSGNLTSSTNVNGNLINIISSFLTETSLINIPQTFMFPWTFPFVINDKVRSKLAISGTMSGTSLIANSGVQDLLSVNIQASSVITSTLTNKPSIQGNLSSSSTSNATLSITKLNSAGVTSNSTIAGTITNRLGVSSSANEVTTISGTVNITEIISVSLQSTTSILGVSSNGITLQGTGLNTISTIGPTNLITNTTLTGNVSALSSVVSQATGQLNINGQLVSLSNLTAQDNVQALLNGQLLSASILSGQAKSQITVTSQVSATPIITGQITMQTICVPSVVNSNAVISSSIIGAFNPLTNLVANTVIGSNASNILNTIGNLCSTSLISESVLDAINLISSVTANSNVNGTITLSSSISGAVNSNSSINNVLDTLQVNCQANISASTNITGNLYNLIDSNLSAVSNINIPQTFSFPLTLPFGFNDGVMKAVAIGGSITVTSSILDSSIFDEASATIQSATLITGNITCALSSQGAAISSSAISTTISSKLGLGGQPSASATITDQITEQMSILANITSASTIGGNLANTINPTTNVVTTTNILSTISIQLGSGGNLTSNSSLSGSITQTMGLINQFVSTSSIGNASIMMSQSLLGTINVTETISNVIDTLQINCQGNLTSASTITGNLCNLISSDLNANGDIILPQTFSYPMTFPLVFNNNIVKALSISGSVNAVSGIINNSVSDLIIASLQSNSLITGTTINNVDLQGLVTETSQIQVTNQAAIMKLCGQLLSASSISATVTLNSSLSESVNVVSTCNGASMLQVSCKGDLVGLSEITGEIYNLISCNLEVISNITLPQTFGFPMTFPLVFNDSIIKSIPISASLFETSNIIDSSINNLVIANLQSNSSITGLISNQTSLQGQLVETTTIELANEIDTISLSGQLRASSNISATTSLNLDLLKTINITSTCSSVSTLEVDCAVDLASLSAINGKLCNLISSSIDVQGDISLPQTFNFPMTFPLVFNNDISKGLSTGVSPITVNSTITAYICNAISSIISDTSSINGAVKNNTALESTFTATTNIVDSSFTGLIPLGSSVQSTTTINSTLLSNVKLNGSITSTTLINASITVKIVENFETSISEKTIIPNIILNAPYPVNTFATTTSHTDILQAEIIATNLQIKCIFYYAQSLNVQICNKNNTVPMLTNLTETVVFNSNITGSQTLNLSTNSNVEFINNLNFTSFKEE